MSSSRTGPFSKLTDVEISTNLCLTDKGGFFTSILSSLTHSLNLPSISNHLTDLVLHCSGPDGLVPISVHAAVLSSQSSFLRDMIISDTEPVLVMPEVELGIVWCWLDLLYTGRCEVTVQEDRVKLVKLLNNVGMTAVAHSLENSNPGLECKVTEVIPESERHYMEEKVDETIVPLPPFKEPNDIKKFGKSKMMPSIFCQMCGKKVKNTSKLRDHYANKHFFSEIRALIDDEKNRSCQFCGKELEDGPMLIYHMVKHVGVTHEKVLHFIEKECCGMDVIPCDTCNICKKKIDTNVSVLGNHLLDNHFKTKMESLVKSDQSECYICNSKLRSKSQLVTHVGIYHGRAMKWYKESLESMAPIAVTPKKISKTCHICGALIAGAGTNWRFPLYAHFSRRHFAEELLRDGRTEDKKCILCGMAGQSESKLVVHLGAKHRLVEKYLDMNVIEKLQTFDIPPHQEMAADDNKETIGDNKSGKRKNKKPRRLQLEVNKPSLKLTVEDKRKVDVNGGSIAEYKVKQLRSLKKMRTSIYPRPEAKICCPFCEKKVRITPVLHSHFFSKHFKADCEEAVKKILKKTEGVCPLCPRFRWSNFSAPRWNIYLHFARKHRITDNLVFSNNEPNKDNVKKILEWFLPCIKFP